MKAIILAAGYATRLYPLTLDKPKALLEIHGKPIINYIIDQLEKIKDIDKIYVVSNGKFAEDFYDWQKTFTPKTPIEIINDGTTSDETKLGAIGNISFVINEKNINEDTIIIAGDNFFNFDLCDFYDFYKTNQKDCVVCGTIDEPERLIHFGVALIDQNNKITQMVEKSQNPPSNTVTYAIYIYKKDSIGKIQTYLAEGNSPDAPGNFVSWLHKKQDVLAYTMNGQCFDIGTLEGYNQVQDMEDLWKQ